MWSVILVIIFTLLSGFYDAQGFIHASKVWQDGRFVWAKAFRSMLGFILGVTLYWLALRYLGQLGIVSAEVQTLLWFGVTIVGVALLSGRFAQWQLVDQIVSFGVLGGIAWLLFRTGG
ncbi:MAG TPA: hypothetical protein VJ768_03155 [Anaerolineales bacterium]|nr:hypothetical protein [Anaerolineales bacterium]